MFFSTFLFIVASSLVCSARSTSGEGREGEEGGDEPMGDKSNQTGLECGMAIPDVGEQYGHELIISSGFSRLLYDPGSL